MRKKKWNYLIVAIFMIAVSVNLTACSDKKKEKEVSKSIQDEYVYQPSFQEFGTEFDSVSNVCKKEDRLYMCGSKWVEDKEEEQGGRQLNYFLSCALDGSDLQKTELKKLKKTEYIATLVLDYQGQFHLITDAYDYNEKTGEGKESYYVHTINQKGKVADTIELKRERSKSKERFFYPNAGNTAYLGDRIYIAGENNIYGFDKKGKEEVYEIKDIRYIQCFVMSPDGKAYIYGNSGEDYGFREFDPETGKTGTLISFGEYKIYNLHAVNAFSENVFAVSDGNSLYTIDISSGKVTEELSWINNDINGDNIKNCFSLGDDGFFVINSSYDNKKGGEITEFITMNKVKASDVKEKKTITFACVSLESGLKDQILSFNRTSPDYRIKVKSYEAYEDSAEKFKMDISSGVMPDILDVGRGISTGQMIKKGLFTDLYPFMEKDEEIKKEDFFPSILKILETDGKLYYMASAFTIQGLAAGKKVFGSQETWDIDDMIKKYQEVPEGTVFLNMARQWFLRNIVYYQMNEYVDYDSNKVNFQSDDFIKLIEFSKCFPDEKEVEEEGGKDLPTLINKGTLLLNDFSLSSVEDLGMYAGLYKKQGGYTVLGYPSSKKSKDLSVYFYSSALAISEQSKEKEGAWNFIRQILTYEYQKSMDLYNGLPTRKDALEKRLAYAQATKFYTDEDGTRVEPLQVTYQYDDYSVEVGPISEEDADIAYSLIERVNGSVSYDTVMEDIFDIVEEEVKAYYAGDKSAKEVVDIIQNRVSIYISENS